MTKKQIASVLYGPKDLRLEERQSEKLEPKDLQIDIRATGLCGSDLHYYQNFRNGDIQLREPLSLGHESAGVVSGVGSDVYDYQIGDHVALEVGVPCGACYRCFDNRYNLCKYMRFRSSGKSFPHFQGTLQQRISHPAMCCFKLPKEMPFVMGALVEPLSVVLHATRRAQFGRRSNTSVLIFGAGAIGLLCAALCTMTGTAKVVEIADVQARRVAFATEHQYATHGMVVPIRKSTNVEEDMEAAKAIAAQACRPIQIEELAESERFEGFDIVFECTGEQACVQAAIYAALPGGKVVLVGMGNPNQTLPLSAAALREVDILGSFRYANDYADAVQILSKLGPEMQDLSAMITHTFSGLANVESAFQTASKPQDEDGNLVLKVVVTQPPFD